MREFTGLLLHDAHVHGIARQGNQLILILHKDIPPCDLAIVTYTLTEEPWIDYEALPAGERSPVMDYLYDEFNVLQDGPTTSYTENILFSNGWEIRLRFRDVQVTLGQPVYPLPDTMLVPVPTSAPARFD